MNQMKLPPIKPGDSLIISSLDKGILLWIARLYIFDSDTLFLSPLRKLMSDKFRPVVSKVLRGAGSLAIAGFPDTKGLAGKANDLGL